MKKLHNANNKKKIELQKSRKPHKQKERRNKQTKRKNKEDDANNR